MRGWETRLQFQFPGLTPRCAELMNCEPFE